MKQIAILLAVYRPNLTYLQQQLASLNQQTYPNCRLYICDDSADDNWFMQIEQMVQQTITQMPYDLYQNTTNLGSSATFEKLTELAQADYFAYCDQDDIWHADKLSVLAEAIEQGVMAYSDLAIIDSHGQKVADSFAQVNKRIEHQAGDDVFPFFIRRNCVTGCSMLIRSEIAKQAMPFYHAYIHDHWLALYAAQQGTIVYVDRALVDYRLHEHNQIGHAKLKNIETRADYIPHKLALEQEKIAKLAQYLTFSSVQKEAWLAEQRFIQARIDWFNKASIKHAIALLSYLPNDRNIVLFEYIIGRLPKTLANKLIQKMKK